MEMANNSNPIMTKRIAAAAAGRSSYKPLILNQRLVVIFWDTFEIT